MKNIFYTLSTLLLITNAFAQTPEWWTAKEIHHFSILESLTRAQGITSDENGHFWFSSWDSLVSTNSKTGPEKKFSVPIPYSLLKLGDNHIGDISFADGKIYASIEDGKYYLHPHICVYDAKTLQFEKKALLPRELQPDGVPWVAVNTDRNQVYSSEYGQMKRINIYDIDSFQPVGFIQSSQVLHSVQGAKVHNGYLYMTANGQTSGFSIYRMDLNSGGVMEVAKFPDGLIEVEGLSFTNENGQEKIVALGVVPLNKNKIERKLRLRKMVLFTFEQI